MNEPKTRTRFFIRLSTVNINSKYFDVNILETEKEVAAICSKRMFKNYKNVPERLKNPKVNKDQMINKQKELELRLKIIKNKNAQRK